MSNSLNSYIHKIYNNLNNELKDKNLDISNKVAINFYIIIPDKNIKYLYPIECLLEEYQKKYYISCMLLSGILNVKDEYLSKNQNYIKKELLKEVNENFIYIFTFFYMKGELVSIQKALIDCFNNPIAPKSSGFEYLDRIHNLGDYFLARSLKERIKTYIRSIK